MLHCCFRSSELLEFKPFFMVSGLEFYFLLLLYQCLILLYLHNDLVAGSQTESQTDIQTDRQSDVLLAHDLISFSESHNYSSYCNIICLFFKNHTFLKYLRKERHRHPLVFQKVVFV